MHRRLKAKQYLDQLRSTAAPRDGTKMRKVATHLWGSAGQQAGKSMSGPRSDSVSR